MPNAMVNEKSFQVLRGARPELRSSASAADSLSSATSMQLFDTMGGLRVMNDPANISTPMLSRQYTASSASVYPDSTSLGSHERTGQAGKAQRPLSVPSIDSHDSYLSGATGSTADHYESEPHSSKRAR